MPALRQIIPALCLASAISATALSVSAVYADSTAAPPDAAAPIASGAPGWRHGPHGGALGPMGYVLHKLNLTADQKAQIKSIMASQKSQFEALRESEKANRQALASTSPSDDSNYPPLLDTAKNNAITRITLMSSTWKQVYEVLTPAQKSQIPSIVAAAQAARQSRMEQWKAEHSTSP